MRAAKQASPDDIDIVSLWGGLRRSLPWLAGFSLAAGIATFAILSLVAPRYASEAQLAIEAKSVNPFPDRKEGGSPDNISSRMDKEAMNTHAKALVAPELLLRVADKLKLRENREFNPELGSIDALGAILRIFGIGAPRPGESDEDRVLGEIAKRLEVAVARESRFIPIRFSAADPQLAADFANELAEAYRASLVKQTIQETKEVVKALDPKIEQLRKDVINAETEVERVRVQIDRTAGGQARTPLIDQRLSELTGELTKADALKNDAEVKWRTARELQATDSAEILPEVQKSPLLQSLVQQRIRVERQLAELSATLLPGHPRMQQINADLAGLKRQIAAEIGKFMQGLEKEAKVANLRVDAINRQINDLKARLVSSSGDEARLRALETSARSKRTELERLQRQYEDNSTVVVTKTVPIEARVISPARPSGVPVFPKKMPFSLLAMAATMLLGIAWTITRDLLRGASPQARGAAGKVAYAAPSGPSFSPSIAAIATGTDKAATSADDEAPKGASAATLARQLVARADGQPGFRTLIAGEHSSVEVARLAAEVAGGIARCKRQVVLIDWTLRGHGISDTLAIASKPGMTDLITGEGHFEQIVTRLPGTEAHYIACGAALPATAPEPDAEHLNMVLDALDEAYDHIVVAGAHGPARELFEQIQGRFDAGVSVADAGPAGSRMTDVKDGMFLGFAVTDIALIRYEQAAVEAAPARTSAIRLPSRKGLPQGREARV